MYINKIIIAIAILCGSFNAIAAEDIDIVWGFNPGSYHANTMRVIANKLNNNQDKFNFNFVHKPGAGGSVAAKSLLKDPENSILSMSSSFFINPIYKANGTRQNLDNYTSIWVNGTGVPLVLLSRDSTTMQELLHKDRITIGVSGAGSISHLMAVELQSIHPNVIIVNHKNMISATVQAAGGHVDAAISWFIDSKGLQEKKLNLLGYTGTTEFVKGVPTLGKFNMPALNVLVANYGIFVSNDMSITRQQELNALFRSIYSDAELDDRYKNGMMQKQYRNLFESHNWFKYEREKWISIIYKIK